VGKSWKKIFKVKVPQTSFSTIHFDLAHIVMPFFLFLLEEFQPYISLVKTFCNSRQEDSEI